MPQTDIESIKDFERNLHTLRNYDGTTYEERKVASESLLNAYSDALSALATARKEAYEEAKSDFGVMLDGYERSSGNLPIRPQPLLRDIHARLRSLQPSEGKTA